MPDLMLLTAMAERLAKADPPFWQGARDGHLMLQRGTTSVPAAPGHPVEPGTLQPFTGWQPASGRGRVWSWIVMHRKYLPAFEADTPYVVAVVELVEGPLVVSALKGPLDGLACDAPVEVDFMVLSDGLSLPVFRLAGTAR
jgi:uncharacterized OB-fold protein